MNVVFAHIFILVAHRLVEVVETYVYHFFVIIVAKLARSKGIVWCFLAKALLKDLFWVIFLDHHELIGGLGSRILLFKVL